MSDFWLTSTARYGEDVMARFRDLFEIRKSNMDFMGGGKPSSDFDDVYCFFADPLLDADFDQIGLLKGDGDEFDISRDLAVRPGAVRY